MVYIPYVKALETTFSIFYRAKYSFNTISSPILANLGMLKSLSNENSNIIPLNFQFTHWHAWGVLKIHFLLIDSVYTKTINSSDLFLAFKGKWNTFFIP